MADDSPAPIKRVPMTYPGAEYVIHVPEGDVQARIDTGWKKVRASKRADTGAVPVQSPSGGTPAQDAR